MTIQEAKIFGKKELISSPTPSLDAEVILQFIMNLDKTHLLLERDKILSQEQEYAFQSAIKKRKTGLPVAYITNHKEFFGYDFYVTPDVLIPKPDTELLVELALEALEDKFRASYEKTGLHSDFIPSVCDMCAGSGCIGISIALNCPGTRVFLFEKYDPALKYLRKNIPDSIKDRVFIIQADIFDFDFTGLPQPDVIASNPPYIPSNEIYSLQKEVKKEPVSALDGGTDGLDFYRCIISKWIPYINRGGFAAFECGEEQAEKIAQMFDPSLKTQILTDLYGVRRFITATFNK